MKAKLLALMGTVLFLQSEASFAQANQSLSNLTSPTAINQNLVFDMGATAGIFTKDDSVTTERLHLGTGAATVDDVDSGALLIYTGNVTGTALSGGLDLATGDSAQQSGDISIHSGAATADGGSTGSINLSSGYGISGNSGVIFLKSGNSDGAYQSGPIFLFTGDSNGGNSGDVVIRPGTATGTRGLVKVESVVRIGANSTTPQHQLNTATTTGSSTATMTNSPVAGNPTGYVQITINGSTAYIPYWQ